MIHSGRWSWLYLMLLLPLPLPAQESEPLRYEDDHLTVRLVPRTPTQIAAFYEARKFPDAMIELLRGQCFITVGIRNKGPEVIWHDLGRWRLEGPQGEIPRRTRPWFRERWAEMDAPMASQSTFRWTLLPESLDFRPDEGEGGNIVLPFQEQPFTIEAPFEAKVDGEAVRRIVRFDDLRCAQEGAP
jgi:hypothetical protein